MSMEHEPDSERPEAFERHLVKLDEIDDLFYDVREDGILTDREGVVAKDAHDNVKQLMEMLHHRGDIQTVDFDRIEANARRINECCRDIRRQLDKVDGETWEHFDGGWMLGNVQTIEDQTDPMVDLREFKHIQE